MQLQPLERKTSDSVREYAYRTLRNSIMHLELAPGTGITEKDVAIKLEVSRTPVREALIKLSREDLLDIYPQKGTFVSLIDINHVEEARFIRWNLEMAVIRTSCDDGFPESAAFELQANINSMEFQIRQPNINPINIFELDNEFHRLIFKGCSKMKAWEVISQSSTHLNRARLLKMLTSGSLWQEVVRQHTEIADSIMNRDAAGSVRSLEEHLGGQNMQLERLRRQHASYFK